MDLRYGANPHQTFASAESVIPGRIPLKVVNGAPSLINLLDALNAWQLVREVRGALGRPAATSFKHVSPAGAAIDEPLSPEERRAHEAEGRELSPLAVAYVRARGADPKSSFGDFIALSDPVDVPTAEIVKREVSDGLVAPGFEPGALEILAGKKGGKYVVFEADPTYEPPPRESREVFGMKIHQDRNARPLTRGDLANVRTGALTEAAIRDLLLGLVVMKYTQSNSVGYALGGQMIGIGAGQQSRVDCTKLAGAKADLWRLRHHRRALDLPFRKEIRRPDRINFRVRWLEGDLTPAEERELAAALAAPIPPLTAEEKREWIAGMTGVSMVSDGFLPFRDNIDHAARHGVSFIAEPGGSVRDEEVVAACREYGIALVHTGIRLFHH